MARRISIILFILLLCLLFYFPPQYLSNICDQIEALAESAVSATLMEEFDLAHANMAQLYEFYLSERSFLHIFLKHEYLEQLEQSIRSVLRLTEVKDQPQALMELEFIITHARFIRAIEVFHPLTIL